MVRHGGSSANRRIRLRTRTDVKLPCKRRFLPSPRLVICACSGARRGAISPLKGWLTRSTNELKYIAAKMASQYSYRQAAAILAGYIRKNDAGVINYGRWRREGRRISTSAVEGTVNRLIGRRLGKGQHMCWTKRGAHLLLQVRCAVLNSEFLRRYQRWFPSVGTRSIGLPWDWIPHRF
jgi:hypothetical protein